MHKKLFSPVWNNYILNNLFLNILKRRVSSRPPNDPYCQAGLVPFCPTGKTIDSMPTMDPTDVIEVYALKKPVW